MSEAQKNAPRMHYIDGLRAIAMLMVLLFHSYLYAGISHLFVHVGHHTINLAHILIFGPFGVNLFLLLSGFCLYWPFVKQKGRPEPTLAQYAYKRCRRILPPYYAALAIFGGLAFMQVLFHIHVFNREFTSHYVVQWLLWHAFMTQNLSVSHVVALDAPLWSLSLEFQLYVFFPLFVEAFRRFNKLGVLLVILILTSTYRAFVPKAAMLIDPAYCFILPYAVFGRLFEFATGMYVAYTVANWRQGEKMPFKIGDYLLAAIVIALGQLKGFVFGDAALGVVFAIIVLTASRSEGALNRFLSKPLLVRLGIFSYSVYLIHQPLLMGIGGKLAKHHLPNLVVWAIVLCVIVPLMIGIGYVYHLIFEKPFINTGSPSKEPLPADDSKVVVNAPVMAAAPTD